MEQLESQPLPAALPPVQIEPPPPALTEDDLPYDDDTPMESDRHVLQMTLLVQTLKLHWRERDDVAVHGNMFVYFSEDQLTTHDFRGPDFFAAQGVRRRDNRKSWLVWREGKGPDVVIELLSESTAKQDKTTKKEIYQERLRVPEYYWYDVEGGELAGFVLRGGKYAPLSPTPEGWLLSEQLGLALVTWRGVYSKENALWLRWALPDGTLLPTDGEVAAQERERAAQERKRAARERKRAEAAEQRERELSEMLARYRERFGELPE
jgi:Uma2 family endonuclease